MHVPDRYRDLIDYLSFVGAAFDVELVPPRHHWFSGPGAHRGHGRGSAQAIDTESLVARTLPGGACVLVVVPAGGMPAERQLRSALGPFEWIGADEDLTITGGLAPGTLPPFGWPYLPGISRVLLDRRIAAAGAVVFKAAAGDRTVFMKAREFQCALGAFELLN